MHEENSRSRHENAGQVAPPGTSRHTATEADQRRLAEYLLAGEIDVAVMVQPEPYEERLRPAPLYKARFVLACPMGHPFTPRASIVIRDMHGQIYLQRQNCEFRDVLRKLCEAAGAEIIRSYRSEKEDWIQSMVAAGSMHRAVRRLRSRLAVAG